MTQPMIQRTTHLKANPMNATFNPQFFRLALALAMAATLALTGAPARAQGSTPVSDLSAASMLPVAVSVMAPVALISAGAALTVVAVEGASVGASVGASAGTVWVLERVSDGVRANVTLSAEAARGLSVAVGTVVVVSAVTAGWVLSAAGQAVAFIPNELGKALLHNERITR